MSGLDGVTERTEKESIEFYKIALKGFIMTKGFASQVQDLDMDKYIAAFSLYMRNSNDAYKYNLPYLSHQHKRFCAFLSSASAKYELLRNIAEAIISSASVKQFIEENSKETPKVKISLNDFLIVDLNKVKPDLDRNIDFHETFSFSGAERDPRHDVITISYGENIRSCKVLLDSNDTARKMNYDEILKLAEDTIGLNEEKAGGTFQNGDS